MRKFSLVILSVSLLLLANTTCADVSHLTDYTITPSSQIGYYHYPAPSRSASLAQARSQPTQYAPRPQQLTRAYQPAAATSTTHQIQPLVKQFTAPALEQAAFTQALTSQGYVFGNGGNDVSAISAALTAAHATSTGRASTGSSTSTSSADSLNVKLPVPFGIAPLNIAQLPLQAGAPYDSIPRGVTSYGTLHPQRR